MSKTNSEDVLGEKWDRCFADTSLKIAGGKKKYEHSQQFEFPLKYNNCVEKFCLHYELLYGLNKISKTLLFILRTGSWKCVLIAFVQEENVANNFWNGIWVRNGIL